MLGALLPFLIQGAPAHALIVHATVVLLPLTTVALLGAAFSSRMRARIGILLPLAGVLSLVLVPITTYTGGQLEHHVYLTPQVLTHVHAADGLLPWAAGLAMITVAIYFLTRGYPVWRARSLRSVGIAVLAVTVAAGTTAEVVYIGHLGAQAVWTGIANQPYHSIPKGDPQ